MNKTRDNEQAESSHGYYESLGGFTLFRARLAAVVE